MIPEPAFNLLAEHVSRHVRLTPTETIIFRALLVPHRIPRKGFLLRPGEISRAESFVTKGCLRAYTIDENGFEHILLFASEGWWVSDLHSFLTQRQATCYIEALEDTEVLQIGKTQLEMLYQQVPKFERFFRMLLQNAYVAQQQRIADGLAHTAAQRYQRFLAHYPQLEQRLSQKHIAAYLGITPVFLSILKRKLLAR
ncbi:hypothetical protein C7T94_14855 [Pedobacter yulinensis]|uniref:Cyclic nucleotide-binding domain-containing protein n=1 Tax=Pedobacter yulinensis TaxID=2126353 RepID=A0A2T3HJ17_9SPHI|nr:Crp/Fnr family transcriptional regulator [Pedobacter yulinensis]PST82434.1 hypothetical protein C7T94_14855 [Pedobacter yulinensis]